MRIALGLVSSAFTGLPAFFGTMMNWSFIMLRWVTTALVGTPWTPGRLFHNHDQLYSGALNEDAPQFRTLQGNVIGSHGCSKLEHGDLLHDSLLARRRLQK